MRFEITPSLIIFHDERPGEHATMFHNGKRVPFNDNASSFDDGARRYAWAFDRPVLASDDILAFATADREVFAMVADDDNASILLNPSWRVLRLGGKPYIVEAVQ